MGPHGSGVLPKLIGLLVTLDPLDILFSINKRGRTQDMILNKYI